MPVWLPSYRQRIAQRIRPAPETVVETEEVIVRVPLGRKITKLFDLANDAASVSYAPPPPLPHPVTKLFDLANDATSVSYAPSP